MMVPTISGRWRAGRWLAFIGGLVPCILAASLAHAQGDGVMVVGIPGDPPVINAGITTDISSSNLSGQVYNTLVRLDPAGEVIPGLAESWEIADDGLTYTFRLFDDVKWHDGEEFTADDVAWSLWNINREFNGPASGLLEAVKSIDATDDLTVTFNLEYPYPPLLRGLAYFNSSTILPRHIFDNGQSPQENPANLAPIGTGPFVFKEYVRGSHIVFERNPDYHLAELPYMDRLVFQIIPNDSARALALQTGDIDFIPYYAMPLGEVESLRADPRVEVEFAKRMIAGIYMAFLNTRHAPLDNKQVRQALYHALNRPDMLEKAGFGFGKVAAGPISSEQQIFYTDDVVSYDYNPAKAEEMLDEAGFPRGADGKRFKLRVSYDLKEGPMNNTAMLMRAQFNAIGVDLDIQGMDSGAWRESAFTRWDFDITMGSFSTGPDPAVGVERLYVCRNIEPLMARNASAYCNPELDEVFAVAGRELDESERIRLYHQVQATLAEDAPHWWLWDRYYPIAFNANLDGILDDLTGYGAFETVRWKN
ncbi:ABC transporter substrate-binding protein [Aureimonas fodinaquatilis]|uniref:ABC transporter substrate-binding protein n=1 Tax=Aureimonas fodinaquatilis TaxID=2565783 RepID=A0A5B0DYI7_9HYPH|nr:ABC transporter substrate-binding protein [Aureimonas fodinaquatilis]KAA0971854.1 ABC transporter substrate-binding protein [Aureimonas fodinaquatilis]